MVNTRHKLASPKRWQQKRYTKKMAIFSYNTTYTLRNLFQWLADVILSAVDDVFLNNAKKITFFFILRPSLEWSRDSKSVENYCQQQLYLSKLVSIFFNTFRKDIMLFRRVVYTSLALYQKIFSRYLQNSVGGRHELENTPI